MHFVHKGHDKLVFAIDDAWLNEAGIDGFTPDGEHYVPQLQEGLRLLAVQDVKPAVRRRGFNRKRLVRILKGYKSGCPLPPIKVMLREDGPQRFELVDGFHRFFSSVAMGYRKIPAVVWRQPR